MWKAFTIACLLLFVIYAFSGCADDTSYETTAATIEESDYHIVFQGDTWPDVVFPHKEHVDREEGVCFRCHYCEKIIGDTNWDCRSCHSAANEDGLCDDDGIHGCTYMQCYNCHDFHARNPGLNCIDCHN